MDTKSLDEILSNLIGTVVMVINLESYRSTLTGYKVEPETYKAKIMSYEDGTLKLLIEYLRDPRKKVKEKAYQFVPLQHIKRVSVSKNERFITI
jgi:hypothetical protein